MDAESARNTATALLLYGCVQLVGEPPLAPGYMKVIMGDALARSTERRCIAATELCTYGGAPMNSLVGECLTSLPRHCREYSLMVSCVLYDEKFPAVITASWYHHPTGRFAAPARNHADKCRLVGCPNTPLSSLGCPHCEHPSVRYCSENCRSVDTLHVEYHEVANGSVTRFLVRALVDAAYKDTQGRSDDEIMQLSDLLFLLAQDKAGNHPLPPEKMVFAVTNLRINKFTVAVRPLTCVCKNGTDPKCKHGHAHRIFKMIQSCDVPAGCSWMATMIVFNGLGDKATCKCGCAHSIHTCLMWYHHETRQMLRPARNSTGRCRLVACQGVPIARCRCCSRPDVLYCSAECQRLDSFVHSKECKNSAKK
jgi:hypothetical protein